jgi:hypothetical protein
VCAAPFRNEQAGDLALQLRRDQDRARLGQRLHARGNVGDVAINLAARVENGGAGFKTDAGDKLWLGCSGVLAIELGQGALDRKRRACRALGIGVFFKGVPGHEYPTALALRAHYLN